MYKIKAYSYDITRYENKAFTYYNIKLFETQNCFKNARNLIL